MTTILVCGSRTFADYNAVARVLDNCPETVTHIIQGEAQGADLFGKRWAIEHNVPHTDVAAEWSKYGKRAGYLRNRKMMDLLIEHGDGFVIAFVDKPLSTSRGTNMMCSIADEEEYRVFVYESSTDQVSRLY